MSGSYDDIIGLPHHVSITRPRMPIANRAAQFSPFAALTGYDSAIGETARLTDERIELDENEISIIDMKLRLLNDMITSRPEILITYFRPDKTKTGGSYITVTENVKKIDDYDKTITLMSGNKILIEDIISIECSMF